MCHQLTYPIERLVLVCRDLETTFADEKWAHFCLSPVRQTRPFLKSRYLVFKNLMLEFLEVTDEVQGEAAFVFFEDWKIATYPTWVGIGIAVDNMERTLHACKKRGVNSLESFCQKDALFNKKFRHHSELLDIKIQNRTVYLTEYDQDFLNQRNAQISISPEKRDAVVVKIPSVVLHQSDNLLFEGKNRLVMNILNKNSQTVNFDFGWIVFKPISIKENG